MIHSALAVLRPAADDTALLTACLKTGEDARNSWEWWRAQRGSTVEALRTELAARRNLLPLLERSAQRNQLRIENVLLDYMRAVTLREQLRAERFRRIAADLLSTIEEAGATAYASRGIALAATVYDDWALRHCHDLDLMIAAEDAARAAAALCRAGLPRDDGSAARRFRVPGHVRPAAVLRHESGLHVVLHTRPFAVAYYDVALNRFMEAGQCASIDGRTVRIPSDEALLVHVLGHASYSSTRRNLRWVTDAWHLLQRRPDMDWRAVADRLDESRMWLAVGVPLRYLVEFGMPVPLPLLERVAERAAALPRMAWDVALGGALSASGGDVAALWRSARSARSRAQLLTWMLAPSAAYVRGAFPEHGHLPVVLAYLQRQVRFLRGRWAAAPPGTGHA